MTTPSYVLLAFSVLSVIVAATFAIVSVIRSRTLILQHIDELESELATTRQKSGETQEAINLLQRQLTEFARTQSRTLELESTSSSVPDVEPPISARVPESDLTALRETAESARRKPETQYGIGDWMGRAFAAFSENRFELAAVYFGEAASVRDAEPLEIAQALFNRAVLLSELNRHEDALKAYDEIVARFQHQAKPPMLDRVIAALVHKALELTELGRYDEAIRTLERLRSWK